MPLKIIHPFSTNMWPPEFKPFLALLCITQKLLTLQSHLHLMRFQISNPNPQKNSKCLHTTYGLRINSVLCKWYDPFPNIWWCCLSGPPWCQKLLHHTIDSIKCSHFQTIIHQAQWACNCAGQDIHGVPVSASLAAMGGIFIGAQEAVSKSKRLYLKPP